MLGGQDLERAATLGGWKYEKSKDNYVKPVFFEGQAFMGIARREKLEVNRAPLHRWWSWCILRRTNAYWSTDTI